MPGDDRQQPTRRARPGGASARPRAWARRCGPGRPPSPSRRSSSRARPATSAIGVSGSAARSAWCQETERSSSESAISASASAIQPGVAVISACPTRRRSRRDSANTTSPASTSTSSSRPARPAIVDGIERPAIERLGARGCSGSSIAPGSIRAPPGRGCPPVQPGGSIQFRYVGVADDPNMGANRKELVRVYVRFAWIAQSNHTLGREQHEQARHQG